MSEKMTVVRLEVDSFKRLRAAHVSPQPTGLVPVRGKNAAGKSSLIESMLAALLGKKGQQELPITEGAHGAHVILDLGDIVVERRWTRDSGGDAKSTLVVRNADGSRVTGPQAVLDSLVGRFADPVAFLEMKPADQVKTVLGVLGLDEQLEALEATAAGQFDERRDLGRDADRLKKAAEELQRAVADLPPVPSEPLDALTNELQEAERHNAKLREWTSDRASAERRGKELAEEIKKLENHLEHLRFQKDKVAETWKEATQSLRDAKPQVDTAVIREKIRAHEAAQEVATKRKMAELASAEAADAIEKHRTADVALKDTRDKIAAMLTSADFPIEGMAYDADAKTITINGIPFSQASQAERLKAAAAVAMAGSPKIRVMFAREGSLLDDDSKLQLAQLAEASGFQLWLEVVDSRREGAGIWIEDGEASQEGVAQG